MPVTRATKETKEAQEKEDLKKNTENSAELTVGVEYSTTNLPAEEAPKKPQHFGKLAMIDVSAYIEKKKTGGTELSYLSWANAWAELKRVYPDATYRVHRFGEKQLPYVYDDGIGFLVSTDMTIEGITHEMWLPVMDGANKAMLKEMYAYTTGSGQYRKEKTCEAANMFDVNKTIMRCLVKNISMFGLGLYIYAGEDLPMEADAAAPEEATPPTLSPLEQTLNEIHDGVMKATEGMDSAAKGSWATKNIKQVIGIMNYRNIKELSDAEKLLAHIKNVNKQEKK